MGVQNDFEFLNSDLWLKYTQQHYLTPKEIFYRLQQQRQIMDSEWQLTERKIVATRKTGAITLFLKTIQPKFWFYPSDTILRKVDEIERIGKQVYDQITSSPVFRKDFLLDSVIEEAITSAIYEGAHSTRAQAEQLLASGQQPKNKDEWMLINNFRAMKWVHEHYVEPLSNEVILRLHKLVTNNSVDGDDVNFSGKYRNDRVFVGPHEGISHSLIQDTVNDMIELTTNHPRYIPPLIKAILIHYFIAYIHPFFDGNGRTARALFYFKAIRNNLSYVELLSVSAYLKDHGKQYEKAFQKVVENEFDVTYFIDFCLDSMLSALQEVSRKVKYLLGLNNLADRFGITVHQVGLLQRMALHKFRAVSIEEYASQISKSREFARKDLKQLVQLGFLTEHKLSKKLVYKVNSRKLKEVSVDTHHVK